MWGAGHKWKSNGKFIRNRQTGEKLLVQRQVYLCGNRLFTRITVEMHQEAEQKMNERLERKKEAEREKREAKQEA